MTQLSRYHRLLTSALTISALTIASGASANKHGHNHNQHGKHKHDNKQRVAVCHKNKNGKYKLQQLPARAAARHFENHDSDVEPTVAADGAVSCPEVNVTRMSICHYRADGTYKLRSLKSHAAVRHLTHHELDREPVVGADGVETCDFVEPPSTTCLIDVNGVPTTVAEFLSAENITDTSFQTDSDSCAVRHSGGSSLAVELYNNADGGGVNIFLFSQNGPNQSLDITSQQQYNDCAFDVETAANAQDTCPEVVNPDF